MEQRSAKQSPAFYRQPCLLIQSSITKPPHNPPHKDPSIHPHNSFITYSTNNSSATKKKLRLIEHKTLVLVLHKTRFTLFLQSRPKSRYCKPHTTPVDQHQHKTPHLVKHKNSFHVEQQLDSAHKFNTPL